MGETHMKASKVRDEIMKFNLRIIGSDHEIAVVEVKKCGSSTTPGVQKDLVKLTILMKDMLDDILNTTLKGADPKDVKSIFVHGVQVVGHKITIMAMHLPMNGIYPMSQIDEFVLPVNAHEFHFMEKAVKGLLMFRHPHGYKRSQTFNWLRTRSIKNQILIPFYCKKLSIPYSNWECELCHVSLCLNKNRNYFKDFHTLEN